MSVSVSFTFPKEMQRNATTRIALDNVAKFVRDLWLARSPYASGDYARGLQRQGSVVVSQGKITITNFSKHAWFIEKGIKTFNLGLAMLNGGKGVHTSADGNRYKIIKVKPKPSANYRKKSAGQQVMRSFKRIMPIGMRLPVVTKYGSLKPYNPRKSLQKPIKGKPAAAGAMEGFFVISEKAIRENPTKWQVPSREGLKLGEKIQKESRPYVVASLRNAIKAEQDRKMRAMGGRSRWSPDMRSVGTMVPPTRGW